MAWIIGRKSDETTVTVLNKKPEFTLAELQVSIPTNFGGVDTDYSYFEITKDEVKRIHDNETYTVLWTANEITGVDFTLQDSKLWIKASIDKSYMLNGGGENATIRFEAWLADLSAIDTSINIVNFRIPVKTPYGVRYGLIDFVAGECEITFDTAISGTWYFPWNAPGFNALRIFNKVSLEVDDGDIF